MRGDPSTALYFLPVVCAYALVAAIVAAGLAGARPPSLVRESWERNTPEEKDVIRIWRLIRSIGWPVFAMSIAARGLRTFAHGVMPFIRRVVTAVFRSIRAYRRWRRGVVVPKAKVVVR